MTPSMLVFAAAALALATLDVPFVAQEKDTCAAAAHDFEKRWVGAGRWTLLVQPADR